MRAVKGKNSKAEIIVRKKLHKMGYRFRIHRKDLPGNPDIVLPKYNLCIFVHGCFWHRHEGCKRTSIPETNQFFWLRKFEKNIERDCVVNNSLLAQGWKVIVIWECETKQSDQLDQLIQKRIEDL